MARIGTRPIRKRQPWHNYGQPPGGKVEINRPPSGGMQRPGVPPAPTSTPEPEFNQVIDGDYRPWNMPMPEPDITQVIDGPYRPAWEAVWGGENEGFLSGFAQWFKDLRSNK